MSSSCRMLFSVPNIPFRCSATTFSHCFSHLQPSSYAHFNRSHSFLSRSILFDNNSNSVHTHTQSQNVGSVCYFPSFVCCVLYFISFSITEKLAVRCQRSSSVRYESLLLFFCEQWKCVARSALLSHIHMLMLLFRPKETKKHRKC